MKQGLTLYNLLCRLSCCCDVDIREIHRGHILTDEEIREQHEELNKRNVAEIVFRNNKLTIDIF